MAAEISGSSDEDEFVRITQPEAPMGPPAKRRKLSSSRKVSDESSGNEEERSFPSSQTLPPEDGSRSGEQEEEADQNRPKSKYKIHIPKNSDLPTDAFFTQPPQRSSSPYRIDQFHWRKPRELTYYAASVPHTSYAAGFTKSACFHGVSFDQAKGPRQKCARTFSSSTGR